MTAREASGWRWDPTLYAGSAAHYARGRVAYPLTLIAAIVDELALDGTGRLLDLGCGPGSLTLPLAGHVRHAVGLDADSDMLAVARRRAAASGIGNVSWVHRRGEDLATDLGAFRVVTLAQSFHWMDRELVAARIREVLTADGAVAFVHATTHRGIDGGDPLPYPRPPHDQIEALIRAYLGSVRRAGAGQRPAEDPHRYGTTPPDAGASGGRDARRVPCGSGAPGEPPAHAPGGRDAVLGAGCDLTPVTSGHERSPAASGCDLTPARSGHELSPAASGFADSRASGSVPGGRAVGSDDLGRIEARVFGAAGFGEPRRREIPRRVVERDLDAVVSAVFSLSYAAPHLFGANLAAFESELRSLLHRAAPEGRFSEEMREIAVDFWRH